MPDNSDHTRTATIIGATGLIGSRLLNLLRDDGYFTAIRLLSRRPLELLHSNVEVRVIDFSDPDQFRSAIEGSDAVFCSVGTTQKKVDGDEEAYRKVDYDIPVNAARHCAETGCQKFLLVSSVGADSSSGNFYLKLKGEVEDAVKVSGVSSVSIFRPSILLGKRNESRPGETIGKFVMSTFSFLLPSRIKPVNASVVAGAMLAAAKSGKLGAEIYQYNEIVKLNGELKQPYRS
jgi:uncharacterized protein YbjT (DUF2867 family)